MNNLNKDFWKEIEEKYPEAFKFFKDWLDQYKKEVNWDDLFNNNLHHRRRHYWSIIMFHHLPDAMQIGIFIEFMVDRNSFPKSDIFGADNWQCILVDYFERVLQPECEFEKD